MNACSCITVVELVTERITSKAVIAANSAWMPLSYLDRTHDGIVNVSDVIVFNMASTASDHGIRPARPTPTRMSNTPPCREDAPPSPNISETAAAAKP